MPISQEFVIANAAIADLIRRVEKLEARLVDGSDPLWGPCKRCGYGEFRSARKPVCCPRCHSAYWDREPRNSTARRPEDPPSKSWGGRGTGRKRSRKVEVEHFVSAAFATETIPPPPRLDIEAARTVDNPMNAQPVVIPEPPAPKPSLAEQLRTIIAMPSPVEPENVEPTFVENRRTHIAPMPDSIVESILTTGEVPTYEEIKAAKEIDDAGTDSSSVVEHPTDTDIASVGEIPARPTDPALQAKKDAFFADAIAAGLVSPVVEGAPQPDEAPFVAPSLAAAVEAEKKDDPFWK